jgi:DNA-directed RNA polymerase subunit RPC12/RpoP
METLDKDSVKKLYKHYRQNRDGIRNCPEMASLCLICASIHIDPVAGVVHRFICRNCRFQFTRYQCSACGATVDSRDPQNSACETCGLRICSCGACGCAK